MPNKTIYVRDEDISLFEEAERLGGDSLSGIIAEALRRFVATKRAEQQGMKECNLTVGVLRSQGDDDTRKVPVRWPLTGRGGGVHRPDQRPG